MLNSDLDLVFQHPPPPSFNPLPFKRITTFNIRATGTPGTAAFTTFQQNLHHLLTTSEIVLLQEVGSGKYLRQALPPGFSLTINPSTPTPAARGKQIAGTAIVYSDTISTTHNISFPPPLLAAYIHNIVLTPKQINLPTISVVNTYINNSSIEQQRLCIQFLNNMTQEEIILLGGDMNFVWTDDDTTSKLPANQTQVRQDMLEVMAKLELEEVHQEAHTHVVNKGDRSNTSRLDHF